MEGRENTDSELLSRIAQLENEKDALQKDIEQLCMQQAGPAYLVVATRMHFQRTTMLEQEIENLKKRLSGCMRENANLQEELSEAYHVKSQLAELHSQEVSKNKEAEKQVKFFQSCMAAAFAERDQSLLEMEKAKESEEHMFIKMNDIQTRFEFLTKSLAKQKAQNVELEKELRKLRENMKLEKESSEAELMALRTSNLVLQEYDGEVVALRISNLVLQDKLYQSLTSEELLRKETHVLKEKNVLLEGTMHKGLMILHQVHSERRNEVVTLLEEWKTAIQSVVYSFQEKFQSDTYIQSTNVECHEPECMDVHITSSADVCYTTKEGRFPSGVMCSKDSDDDYKALAQATQEKVDALLLLSQQEELHLLQKNIQTALEKKCEDLQLTLVQVTNEKVKALLELAELRQKYQRMQELKVENASLRESIMSVEHITSCIHKLRLSLMKVGDLKVSRIDQGLLEDLDGIIFEANLIKTALGSSLPVSWSAEDGGGSFNGSAAEDLGSNDRVDCVSAAGFEMVELLMMAAQFQKASLVQNI